MASWYDRYDDVIIIILSKINSLLVDPIRICTQLGMGSAVETLCGQAYGAHRYGMLGVYMQRATIVLVITGIPLTVVYVFSGQLLLLLGESESVASAASVFVYGLIPQIYAYAVNFPIQKFLQSQSIVIPSAFISAATLVLHFLLSWIAVYKLGWGLIGKNYTIPHHTCNLTLCRKRVILEFYNFSQVRRWC